MSELSVGQPLLGSSDPWASQEGAPTYALTCHPQLRLSQGHPSSRWQPSTLPSPPFPGAAPPQTASCPWSQVECLPCKPRPPEMWSGCTQPCFWAHCLWAESDSGDSSFPQEDLGYLSSPGGWNLLFAFGPDPAKTARCVNFMHCK